jgi:hypothetical protein
LLSWTYEDYEDYEDIATSQSLDEVRTLHRFTRSPPTLLQLYPGRTLQVLLSHPSVSTVPMSHSSRKLSRTLKGQRQDLLVMPVVGRSAMSTPDEYWCLGCLVV